MQRREASCFMKVRFMNKSEQAKKPLCRVLSCGLLAVGALTGCATSPAGNRQSETLIDRAGVDIIAADSTRQLTYLKERSATERFCRGPGADSMNTASEGVSVQLPVQGSSVGLGEQKTLGGVDLGGRNPAVLIARELMYRACELASNTNADAVTERQIYLQFLQAVVSISKVQVGTGVAALAADPVAPAMLGTQPATTVPTSTSILMPTSTPDTPTPGAN